MHKIIKKSIDYSVNDHVPILIKLKGINMYIFDVVSKLYNQPKSKTLL